jgi:putative DNA primase/helicase
MSERLRADDVRAAVLTWAVEGCAEWQRIGIGKPALVADASAKLREDNDWLGGFLELFELDAGSTIAAPVLREMYVRYCKEEGQFADSTKELQAQIEARLPSVRYVKVMGARIWRGLRVRQVDPTQGGWTVPDEPEPTPPPEHFTEYPYEQEELL